MENPFALATGLCKHLGDSKERAMREKMITADRLAAFSDEIFAVALTVMVLELKAPDQSAFSALWPLALYTIPRARACARGSTSPNR
jgi:hypothetical protein